MYRALLVTLMLCGTATAKSPIGTYKKTAGDAKIELTFKKTELTLKIEANGSEIIIEGNYGITKTGTLFGIITKVKKDDTGDAPDEGHLFSFQIEVKDNTIKVSKLKPASDDAKRIFEGEYKK